jgi:hypothetical protein
LGPFLTAYTKGNKLKQKKEDKCKTYSLGTILVIRIGKKKYSTTGNIINSRQQKVTDQKACLELVQ